MRAAVVVLLALALLGGCAGEAPRPPATAASHAPVAPVPPPLVPAANPLGARAAALAGSFVGVPYRYGGDTPSGFDCSGLVYYVYSELGLSVPRTAAQQRGAARHVPEEALAPGDLVFFYTPEDHVGIYLGNGEFVHAPATGRTVERARLDQPFFIMGYAGGGRFAVP
jgi:cell wall-associated NlpC family hydrolase